jgi:hypothetical protein
MSSVTIDKIWFNEIVPNENQFCRVAIPDYLHLENRSTGDLERYDILGSRYNFLRVNGP